MIYKKILRQARDEICQDWRTSCAESADHPRAMELFDRYKLPGFHDPFAGDALPPDEEVHNAYYLRQSFLSLFFCFF